MKDIETSLLGIIADLNKIINNLNLKIDELKNENKELYSKIIEVYNETKKMTEENAILKCHLEEMENNYQENDQATYKSLSDPVIGKACEEEQKNITYVKLDKSKR